MNETLVAFISTIIGAILGFLGAVLGGIIVENRNRKKELREFYAWVSSLLYRLLVKKEIDKVKISLTAKDLHYTLNKLWFQVPQKKNGLAIRDLVFQFLKGGDQLDELAENEEIKKLYEWLDKR